MRISQLDLKAYGHFTDRRITFPSGADFHMAYGPNEAGKTTISRALTSALFGIEQQTRDGYLHAYSDMRVGVVLESSAMPPLAAMRRKAKKNSLVKYDPKTGEELGEVIPDEQLAAMTGELGEGLFNSMFGIDHDTLVAGGKALAEGKGEIGESLFAAGAGLSSVKALRDRLAGQANGLFRPRASTTSIYKTLETYKEARSSVKAAQARPAEWEALKKRVDEAAAAYEEARERQESLQRQTRSLERLAALLPDVAKRADSLARIAALGEVVKLPADAASARAAFEVESRNATESIQTASDKLTRFRSELDGIVVPESILAESGPIESLHYAIGGYRSARDNAAGASERMKQSRERVDALLREIGEVDQEDIRAAIPGATIRARVRSLATQSVKLQGELLAANNQVTAARKELNELTDELDELGTAEVPASLENLVAAVEQEGNPEAKADDLASEANVLREALLREAAALSDKHFDDILAVKPPLAAEIQRFRSEKDDFERRLTIHRDKVKTLEDDLAAVNGEIEGNARAGDIPTAEQLGAERQIRDSLWLRIRRNVFPDAGDRAAPEAPPSAAEYESSVKGADVIADRRFTEAEKVTQFAELEKRRIQMEHSLRLESSRQAELNRGFDEIKQNWQSLLAGHGLPLLGVAETMEWLAQRALVVQRHVSFTEKHAAATGAQQKAAASRESLSAALSEAGLGPCGEKEPLVRALARARKFIEDVGKQAARRGVLLRRKKSAELKAEEADREVEDKVRAIEEWKQKWSEAMKTVRLDAEAGDSEADVRLGQFDSLEKSLDGFEAATSDLAIAQTTIDRIEAEVSRLSVLTNLSRDGMPADAVAETLYQKLETARELSGRRKELEAALKEVELSRDEAKRAMETADRGLAVLMKSAGCATLTELAQAEARSTELLRLETEVVDLERKLLERAGMTVPEFVAQATGQDLALVRASLDGAEVALTECKSQVEELHGTLIEARSAFGKIDGGAVAAEAEQTAADAAARLSVLISEYSSACIASAVLGDVIESYQQRHQGPMLTRASEIYSAITGGRYVRIATDFDEDMTVLVAVRPDGKRLTVNKLSSGRRDQIFLALRLAAIESHVANQEPMPVIVDDIVINFDDAAASATFQVLAELSKKTQVIFFTHHEHLLDRAASALGEAAFTAHQL